MSYKSKLLCVILLTLVMLLPVLILSSVQAAPSDLDYDPNVLDYGIYWFGAGHDSQKFVIGEANPYFNPSKPTVIFVHGWQPNISASNPPDFVYDVSDGCTTCNNDMAEAWINAGWNIGIFYWNQFSDEPDNVKYAEAKIWTDNGPQYMRWRQGGSIYRDAPAGTPNAGDLFYEAYVAAMTEHDYTGGNIRIAGHSLGNQMAMYLTKRVSDEIDAGEVPAKLLPDRVALLDPYWSTDTKDYLGGKKTGTVIREYVDELLPKGVLFEWYWSSNLTVNPHGDTNNALKPMMMYAEMYPTVFVADDMSKHRAAWNLYFWSYAFPESPPCTGVGDDCRLLAQMSDDQLASLMRSDYRWAQNGGQSTSTPDDDVYTSTLQAGAPYTVTQLQTNPPTQGAGGVITLTATVTSASGPAADGALVTFDTDLGDISARSVTTGGGAVARITSAVAGTAHISATTRGAGGTVQSTAVVTFTDCLTPLTGVRIDGPVGVTGTLYVDSLYTFNAVITPTNATPIITYTWSSTPTNGQNHDTATYQWPVSGTYTITLTAENCGGPVDAEPRVVHIAHQEWEYIYLPLVLRNY